MPHRSHTGPPCPQRSIEEPWLGTRHTAGKKAELEELWGVNMDPESRNLHKSHEQAKAGDEFRIVEASQNQALARARWEGLAS